MAERRSAQRLVGDSSVHLFKQHMDLIAHYNALVQSTDNEMLQMIALLDKTRLSWLTSVQENAGLKAVKESIERENKKLLSELDATKGRLKESEALATTLRTTMQSMKIEIEEYQRRFQQIKTMLRENCENAGGMTKLKELSFLADASSERSKRQGTSRAAQPQLQSSRGSDLSPTNTDDIDYDKTGETLEDEDGEIMGVPAQNNARHNRADYRRGAAPHPEERRTRTQKPATKRKSAPRGRPLPSHISEEEEEIFVAAEQPQCPTPPKRSREARGREFTATTTITVDTSGSTPMRKNVVITKPPSGRLAHRRSQSAPGVPHCQPQQVKERAGGTPKAQKCGSTADIRTPVGTSGFGSGWTCGVPIAERNHTWEEESSFFAFNTPCTACGSSLTTKHLKCKGEGCKFMVHPKCRARAPIPCVPYKQTPKKLKQRPRLVDLCPDTQPKIPGMLMRCVVALEKDRLGFEGIYRRAGSKTEVAKLLDDFNSKVAPDLSTRETETITSCIVQFLQGLREPLVPSNSFKEFEEAAKQAGVQALMEVVDDLPIPNRDTLAYMCAHLQRVAENAHANKMSPVNLSRVLAQTMIDGSKRAKNNDEEYREAESRQHILQRLLDIPNQYWMNFVNAAVITGQLGSTPRSTISLRGMAASASRVPAGPRTIDFSGSDQSMLGPAVTDTHLVQPIPRRPGKHALGGPY